MPTTRKSVDPSVHSGPVGVYLAVLTLLVLAVLVRLQPPAVVAHTSPLDVFSAERAAASLQVLAREPGPVGSTRHDQTRDWLLTQLRNLNLEVELQTTHAATEHSGAIRASRVENIVARLKGLRPGPSVLLAAHYDTVPDSPGAGDNRSGVAVLLETARALLHGPWLRNDVVFLFSDAEELGLLGAQAFMAEHEWANTVGIALNFDARGNAGLAAMYDTSNKNGRLVEWFAKAAPHPTSNSLLHELVQFLPNDSDFSVFLRAGKAGYAFAFGDGFQHYHRATDNIASLDLRSVQHQGSYALALSRVLANVDLTQPAAPNRVYFDIFGFKVIHYTQELAYLGGWTALLGALSLIVLGKRRNLFLIYEVLVGVFLTCGLPLLAAAAVYAWQVSLTVVFGAEHFPFSQYTILCSTALLSLLVTVPITVILRTRISQTGLLVGAISTWALAAWVTSLFLPGASYVFTWPALGAELAVAVLILRTNMLNKNPHERLLLTLAAAPAVGFGTVLSHTIGTLVGSTQPWAFAGVLVFSSSLILPWLAQLVGNQLKKCIIFLMVLAGGTTSILIIKSILHPTTVPLSQHTEKTTPQLVPSVQIVFDEVQGDERIVVLRIISQRNAQCVWLWPTPEAPPITGIHVNGKLPMPWRQSAIRTSAPDKLTIESCGARNHPVDIELHVPAYQEIPVMIADVSYETPALAIFELPKHLRYFGDAHAHDRTYLSTAYQIPAQSRDPFYDRPRF